jgi:spore protease
MLGNLRIRTDLALEDTERIKEEQVEIRGVEIQEHYEQETDIRTTVVKIKTENGAKAMGRPQGTYITIEAPNLSVPDEDYHREVSEEIARHLRQLMDFKEASSALVVGLGNQGITSDSLGPQVVGNVHVNRHMIREYGVKGSSGEKLHMISAIAPGVMAQTGMETSEIIEGIVTETKPEIVIAIDALAARSTRRLNRTIQITDTGIHPGSGVGNHRSGLTEETLGVKVIGIGVPTVVDAATIVLDSVEHMIKTLDEQDQEVMCRELVSPQLYGMFVTPKDVDETIKYLSFTISEGLHMAFEEE